MKWWIVGIVGGILAIVLGFKFLYDVFHKAGVDFGHNYPKKKREK